MSPTYGHKMNMHPVDYGRAMDYRSSYDPTGQYAASVNSELLSELTDPSSNYSIQDHLATLRGHNGHMGDPSRTSRTIDSGNRNISEWHRRTSGRATSVKLGSTRRSPAGRAVSVNIGPTRRPTAGRAVSVKLGATRRGTSSGAKAAKRTMSLSKKMAAGGLLGGLALGGGYVAARRPHRNQQQYQ